MRAVATLSMLGVLPWLTFSAQAAEKVSRAEDRAEVAVAIYNDSLALIKEVRRLDLERGENDIALRDVSAKMRPETASLRALTGAPLRLIEQNFDFDLLTPQKLLEKYVGQSVGVIRTNPATGAETRETAQVLATNGGVVLKFADRIETGVPGRLTFDSIPANLRDRPTLVVKLESATAGRQTAELSYLSGGLSWKGDYVAELGAAETKMDLAGWVTLTNQSGTGYENAKLQLVAGDVNRVQEDFAVRPMAKAMVAAAPMREMAREEVFDYPRVQEGCEGQRHLHRRGRHRPHGEERQGPAEDGQCLRRYGQPQADRLQAGGRPTQSGLRDQLAHRIQQRQGTGRDGQGGRTDARRLGNGWREPAPHEGRCPLGGLAGPSAGGWQGGAGILGAGALSGKLERQA